MVEITNHDDVAHYESRIFLQRQCLSGGVMDVDSEARAFHALNAQRIGTGNALTDGTARRYRGIRVAIVDSAHAPPALPPVGSAGIHDVSRAAIVVTGVAG
jgi:hypothetical protein